jgi:hypothetical protein
MCYDEIAAEPMRRALCQRQEFIEKKMMGGLCFVANGRMCCRVTGSALLIRVGAPALEQALKRPHARPMEIAGQQLVQFVCVGPKAT